MATRNDLTVRQPVGTSVDRAFEVFIRQTHDWWPTMYRLGASDRTGLVIDVDRGCWFEVGSDGTEVPWGQVLGFDAPRSVQLGWQITPSFGAEPDSERASRVDVRFEPVEEGCVVTLVHSGFERHGEGWESMRQGVDGDGGWPGILAAFAAVAEG